MNKILYFFALFSLCFISCSTGKEDKPIESDPIIVSQLIGTWKGVIEIPEKLRLAPDDKVHYLNIHFDVNSGWMQMTYAGNEAYDSNGMLKNKYFPITTTDSKQYFTWTVNSSQAIIVKEGPHIIEMQSNILKANYIVLWVDWAENGLSFQNNLVVDDYRYLCEKAN